MQKLVSIQPRTSPPQFVARALQIIVAILGVLLYSPRWDRAHVGRPSCPSTCCSWVPAGMAIYPGQAAGRPNFRGLVLGCIDADFAIKYSFCSSSRSTRLTHFLHRSGAISPCWSLVAFFLRRGRGFESCFVEVFSSSSSSRIVWVFFFQAFVLLAIPTFAPLRTQNCQSFALFCRCSVILKSFF